MLNYTPQKAVAVLLILSCLFFLVVFVMGYDKNVKTLVATDDCVMQIIDMNGEHYAYLWLAPTPVIEDTISFTVGWRNDTLSGYDSVLVYRGGPSDNKVLLRIKYHVPRSLEEIGLKE